MIFPLNFGFFPFQFTLDSALCVRARFFPNPAAATEAFFFLAILPGLARQPLPQQLATDQHPQRHHSGDHGRNRQ
jgi:hypothetical protein